MNRVAAVILRVAPKVEVALELPSIRTPVRERMRRQKRRHASSQQLPEIIVMTFPKDHPEVFICKGLRRGKLELENMALRVEYDKRRGT